MLGTFGKRYATVLKTKRILAQSTTVVQKEVERRPKTTKGTPKEHQKNIKALPVLCFMIEINLVLLGHVNKAKHRLVYPLRNHLAP